jgi:hypothetical protein
MFDNYLIEVEDREAGILIRTGNVFTFHAVTRAFIGLEGTVYPDAFAAERAARRHLQNSRRRRVVKAPQIGDQVAVA